MPREIQSDGKNLIFKDYLNRSVSIAYDLMRSEERRLIRPALEDCLADPSEVWSSIEPFEGKDYSFFKYFKFQRTIQQKFNLEDLIGKLHNWYMFSYKDFIAELSKKKVKLSLTQKAEWEDYFLQESKKAMDIKHQIDTTDKEIDQMVYALYGLSEEEIN